MGPLGHGAVVKALPYRQYQVKMDGSGRLSLRNRQFLRKFKPLLMVQKPRQHLLGVVSYSSPTPSLVIKLLHLLMIPHHLKIGTLQLAQPNCPPSPVLGPAGGLLRPGTPDLDTAGSPAIRCSSRSTRGQPSRFKDFVTVSEYDNACGHVAALVPQAGEIDDNGMQIDGNGVLYLDALKLLP